MTAGIHGAKLSVRDTTVSKLKEKFGNAEIQAFLTEFQIAADPESLTEREARFILRQRSLDSLRDRILAERQAPEDKSGKGTIRPSEVTDPDLLFQDDAINKTVNVQLPRTLAVLNDPIFANRVVRWCYQQKRSSTEADDANDVGSERG